MKKALLILIALLSLGSCKSSKKSISKTKVKPTETTKSAKSINKNASSIIEYAKRFEGVKYKYGGTSKKGMDCSGLVYTAFKENDIYIPRTTSNLSTEGNWIDLKEVIEGDLLFFATRKNSRRVNHVGLVTKVKSDHVEFIHASTSKGVIISSLKERYWYLAFVQARRLL